VYLGVTARHGDVVEEDVAVGVATRPGHRPVERVALPHVRAPADHEDRVARGELAGDERDVVIFGFDHRVDSRDGGGALTTLRVG
jgi:hypothetical protein